MAPVNLPVKWYAALHFKNGQVLVGFLVVVWLIYMNGNVLLRQRETSSQSSAKSVGVIFKFKVGFTEFVE